MQQIESLKTNLATTSLAGGEGELQRRISELGDWFHNIDLHGVSTSPQHFLGDYPSIKWKKIAPSLPLDLRGSTVLDIGCNAGFYSLEMKRRGADRVVAVDVDDRYLRQAQFAAEMLHLEIEFRKCSVYDVDSIPGQFDIVFFMGLFYHLRYPLFALDKIIKKVGRTLVFQSIPIFPACTSSKKTMQGITPTGGSPTGVRPRPCCAAQGWKLSRIRRRKLGSASPGRS